MLDKPLLGVEMAAEQHHGLKGCWGPCSPNHYDFRGPEPLSRIKDWNVLSMCFNLVLAMFHLLRFEGELGQESLQVPDPSHGGLPMCPAVNLSVRICPCTAVAMA